MTDSELAERVDTRGTNHRQSFLGSHRAFAACTREFARLSDEIRQSVAALPGVATDEKTTVRQSPDRFIVQLGPVALTIAWLRHGSDMVESGELLVIVWRGVVAPSQRVQPERPRVGPAPFAATALWEQVFTPIAEDETSWAWQPINQRGESWSSTSLSAMCVERLRAAYQECSAAD
jgi:hypothetical protein